MQEMLASERGSSAQAAQDIDIDDLLDDPELERLHGERLEAMQREAEKRATLQRKGHGELQVVPLLTIRRAQVTCQDLSIAQIC
jgi:hypothetical protein